MKNVNFRGIGAFAAGLIALSSVMVIAAASPAQADTSVVATCGGGYGLRSCSVAIRKLQDPKETEEERRLSAQRDAEWEARCKPTVYHDGLGMARYVYAASGCEFGRYR